MKNYIKILILINFFFINSFYFLKKKLLKFFFLENNLKNKYNKKNIYLNFFKKKKIKNFSFSSFFFLKIFKKYNWALNYDLFFRFTNLNIYNSGIKKKYFFFNNLKSNLKKINKNFINYKMPAIGGLSSSKNIIFKRPVFLITGNFKYLPLNYTWSGYFVPYIIRKKLTNFIENLNIFIFIKNYNFDYYNSIIFYKKYKFYTIFYNQKPNLNLDILKFFTKKKKINFFEYSSFLKQYSYISEKYYNYNFLKFNWILKKKINFLDSKKLLNINTASKQKYMLKFHRLSLNTLFSYKYRSHKLTKIFQKIYKFNNKYFLYFKKLELKLMFILLRSKIVYNYYDSLWLIKNGYVFINGLLCLNIYFILKKNDRIQLINNYYEYIYQRFIISNNLTRYCRMWSTMFKLQKSINQPYKTQSKQKLKWVIKSIWILTDIPKYLEVDFQIYTIFILYEPFSNIDIFPFFFSHFKFPLMRFFNWKYYY